MKIKVAVVFVVVVLAVLQAVLFGDSPATGMVTGTEERIVTKVIDGDTIVVEGGDRIRLLDIDTPEKGEKCYKEAKGRLAELVDGKKIKIQRRGEDKDRYDRLLRYVFYNDNNVNILLVKEGLANLYFYDKNTPYMKELLEAELHAKEDALCVWK